MYKIADLVWRRRWGAWRRPKTLVSSEGAPSYARCLSPANDKYTDDPFLLEVLPRRDFFGSEMLAAPLVANGLSEGRAQKICKLTFLLGWMTFRVGVSRTEVRSGQTGSWQRSLFTAL